MIITSMTCPSSGPPNAEIMVVGEAPTADDLQQHQPFSGAPGVELSLMLGEAGLQRSNLFLTNVARSRPPGGDPNNWLASTKAEETALLAKGGIKYNGRVIALELYEGIALLRAEIERVRPKLIIALGTISCWVLTGEWSVSNWRGSNLVASLSSEWRPACVPTYTPAGVLRQWSLRRVVVQDLRRARDVAKNGAPVVRYNFCVEPSFTQAIAALDYLDEKLATATEPVRLSVDIETRNYHIACLGIAWSRTDAICFPFLDSRRPDGYWTLAEESEIVYRLYRVHTHANAVIIGQNFLYDAQYIWRYFGFVPRVVRDTMLAQHLCFPGLPKSLDFIASMYCEQYRYWKEDGKTWSDSMDERVLWKYNCEDCVRTFECDTALEQVISSLNLAPQYSFQMRVWQATMRMMNRGIAIDNDRRAQLESEMQAHATSLLADIEYFAGHALNPKSPKQMKEFFYGELQLPPVYKRGKRAQPGKVRQPSCDDECLQRIAAREPLVRPLINAIGDYRSVGVYNSTFLADKRDVDGLIRCSFNPAGAVTFRFSSSENPFGSGMNLQNIPGKEKDMS